MTVDLKDWAQPSRALVLGFALSVLLLHSPFALAQECDDLNWMCSDGSLTPIPGTCGPIISGPSNMSPPNPDAIPDCDPKDNSCVIDGLRRHPGDEWPDTTTFTLSAPDAKPDDFFPSSRFDNLSGRTGNDVPGAKFVCSGVGPNCVGPEFDPNANIAAFRGGDARLPSPQATEPLTIKLAVPSSDPVAANGAFQLSETDLYFPGYIPFVFTRFYRSDVNFQSSLGFGWNHTFGRKIVPAKGRLVDGKSCSSAPFDVFYVTETMDRIRFSYAATDDVGQHYQAPEAASLHLVRKPGQDGPWVLQEGDKTLFSVFDPVNGDLIGINDNTGHSLVLTWSHPVVDANGVSNGVYEDPNGYLESVTDTRGTKIYFHYTEPGQEPSTPAPPNGSPKKFRPLTCITLSTASDSCKTAPLVTFTTDQGTARLNDSSHPEFNLVHVADAAGHGPTYTYYGAGVVDYTFLQVEYAPDAEVDSACSALCGSKEDDCRNLDLCSVEAIHPCAMRTPTTDLSKADREASPCFGYCMTGWDGDDQTFTTAYSRCNVAAGCPVGMKQCRDFGKPACYQYWYWPGFDQYGRAYNKISRGWGCSDYSPAQNNFDSCAQFRATCEAQALAAAAGSLPQCRASCKATCLSQKTATFYNGTRHYAYGVPLSLYHNLLRVIDADNRVVIDNTYGTDPFSPNFDRVIAQKQGSGPDHTIKFDYHDFRAEQVPYVTKPQVNLLAGFHAVQVCPRTLTGLGYDKAVVSISANQFQQPAYAVVITDIGGVSRTNYFDAEWRPLREYNNTTGTAIDYNYDPPSGLLSAIQEPSGTRTCVERDDTGRPISVTRMPRSTKFNGIPYDSAQPEVTTYSYDDDGQIVEIDRDPYGDSATGISLIRDGYERIAAIGQSVSKSRAIWTCYSYVPPRNVGIEQPKGSTIGIPESGTSQQERAMPGRAALLGMIYSNPTPSQTPRPGEAISTTSVLKAVYGSRPPMMTQPRPRGLTFPRSGCAAKLSVAPFIPRATVAMFPVSVEEPDGSIVALSSPTVLGPSETSMDANGADPLPTYRQYDLTDPFGLTVETGTGTLAAKKAGSAKHVISDKNSGLILTTGVQDPNSQSWVDSSLDYNDSRQLIQVITPTLRKNFEVDELDHVTSATETVIDPKCVSGKIKGTTQLRRCQTRTSCFHYDMKGRLLDQMFPAGNVEHYEYNGFGAVSSIKRGSLKQTPNWATSCAVPQGSTDHLEEVSKHVYDNTGTLVGLDREGLHADFVTDGLGRVIDTAVPHHFQVSISGSLLTTSRHHVIGYDEVGRVTWEGIFDSPPDRYQRPATLLPSMYSMTEYSYDGLGRMVSRKDWRFINDGVNPPQPDAEGLIAKTLIDYDDGHSQVKVTDPEGKVTITSYDGVRRMTHLTRASNTLNQIDINYSYASQGGALTVTSNAAPLTRTFLYNPQGSLQQIAAGKTVFVSASYDPYGRFTGRTLAGLGAESVQYDGFGRVFTATRQVQAPNQQTVLAKVVYGHDNNDRLTTVIDARGNATKFFYDSLDRVSKRTDALGTSTYTYYPGSRRLNEVTDPAQTVQDFRYGYDGQIIEQITTSGPSVSGKPNAIDRTFFYTLLGQLYKAILAGAGPKGSDMGVTFQYDSLGRKINESNEALPVSVSRSFSPGKVVQSVMQGNTAIASMESSYDAMYRPTAVSVKTGQITSPVASLTYDGGILSSASFGNGVTQKFDRDDLGRVTGSNAMFNASSVASIQDNLGIDGIPRERRHTLGSSLTSVDYFETDVARRLIVENLRQPDAGFHGTAPTNDVVEPLLNKKLRYSAYSLDSAGNLLSRSGTNPLSPGPPDGANRYPAMNGDNVGYDGAGDLKAVGQFESYSFNGLGQLTDAQVGNASVALTYDALGRIVFKQTSKGTTAFVWDGDTPFAYGSPDAPDQLRLIASAGPQRLALLDQLGKGKPWYLHPATDLVTPMAVTDGKGALAEGYAFSAGGEPTIFDPTGNEMPTSSEAVSNPILFQGQMYFPELQLYSMGARFYKTSWQRFMSPDPIGPSDDPNLYAFVQDRFLTHWDPSGLTGNTQVSFYGGRTFEVSPQGKAWLDRNVFNPDGSFKNTTVVTRYSGPWHMPMSDIVNNPTTPIGFWLGFLSGASFGMAANALSGGLGGSMLGVPFFEHYNTDTWDHLSWFDKGAEFGAMMGSIAPLAQPAAEGTAILDQEVVPAGRVPELGSGFPSPEGSPTTVVNESPTATSSRFDIGYVRPGKTSAIGGSDAEMFSRGDWEAFVSGWKDIRGFENATSDVAEYTEAAGGQRVCPRFPDAGSQYFDSHAEAQASTKYNFIYVDKEMCPNCVDFTLPSVAQGRNATIIVQDPAGMFQFGPNGDWYFSAPK